MVRDKVADINQGVQDIQVGTSIVWYVIRLLILKFKIFCYHLAKVCEKMHLFNY